ncbi:MAG: hypothetical protein M2R45_04625 [Verrucomicrobia subdivision 3 bacterium]|nr:hypothetical protein [Limisphaerales bacterium]MCS1417312.1 hypothetical protein [Limisphaerales bacterium]
MSKVIGITIFILVGVAGIRFAAYYQEVNRQVEQQENRFEDPVPVVVIEPGMPPTLEPLLEAAKGKGATELKKWLDQYRGYVKEPRLSEIELDYVVMVGRTDPPEARRVFAEVRRRNDESSPLAERISRLAKTYQ